VKRREKGYYENQPTSELKRLIEMYPRLIKREYERKYRNQRQIDIYQARLQLIELVLYERERLT
jgi:hypothetical protein